MTNTLTIANRPHLPQVAARQIEALDYFLLSDDNAGRVEQVANDGHTVRIAVSHMVTNEIHVFTFPAEQILSVLPG